MARRVTGPDAGVRLGVLQRALWKCERCGEPATSVSVHHRTPRGMGGTRDREINSPANLALLCGSGTTGCHGWIESHRTDAYGEGWLVKRGQDPEQIPVVDSDGKSWVLKHDGSKELR